jgi:hypothetical protein
VRDDCAYFTRVRELIVVVVVVVKLFISILGRFTVQYFTVYYRYMVKEKEKERIRRMVFPGLWRG